MRIGIDLGGTKIEAISIDETGRELLRTRIQTPHDDYEAILSAIAGLLEKIEQQVGVAETVGIGAPGSFSASTGLVKNSNTVCLNGQSLKRDLETRLGRRLAIENDANCFTLSEALDGAAAGARCVFGVILGTGVGAGICVDGRLLIGANSICGEWGHNPLPWPNDEEHPGRACYCGRHGCIETFLSGSGLATDYLALGGAPLPAHEIAIQATAGQPLAQKALSRYTERLAKALATIINVLDPDVIVLGGGISNMARLYKRVPELWKQWVFSDSIETQLVQNHHGDSSGVRGAARLV